MILNQPPKKKRFVLIPLVCMPVAFIVWILWIFNFFGDRPHIKIQDKISLEEIPREEKINLGRSVVLEAEIFVNKGKLCETKIEIKKENSTYSLTLTPERETRGKGEKLIFPISLEGMTSMEGEVLLLITAKNCSFLPKKEKYEGHAFIDLVSPQVSLTSTQHYINQGGAEFATYHTSPDTVWSGIRIGPYEFRGYPRTDKPKDSGEYFSFFVYSYELPADTPIFVVARDAAGNEALAPLVPAKFFPKEFRSRRIDIDDQFINTKVAAIISQTTGLKSEGDALKDFLLVNRTLRKTNTQFLKEISKNSDLTFYWKDAFIPLSNAAVNASFADFRDYYYQDQKVDSQVHLGFDLAAIKQYPIESSAEGKVAFVGYLGIYGNTVIVDHGYGLMTLYGHLTSMDVQKGDLIHQKQILGKSGETGLAGGDHLHYSILIQGIQTNPIEFWDQHWIDDHIYLRIKNSVL